jgi:hypothetical protein
MAYPLVTVEVQLSGNVAILVGWPDAFCSVVVDVLTADLAKAATPPSQPQREPETMPEDFADPASTANAADPATLDHLDPSPWQEQDLQEQDLQVQAEPAPGDWTTSAPEFRDEAPQDAPPPPPAPEPRSPGAPAPAAGLFGLLGDTGSEEWVTDDAVPDEPAPDEPSADWAPPSVASSWLTEPVPAETAPTEEAPSDRSSSEQSSSEEASSEEPSDEAPLSSFHSATSALFAASDPEVEERAEKFFSGEHPEAGEEIAAFAEEPAQFQPPAPTGGMTPQAFSSRMLQWPEPFRSVVYLGENPSHPRRRKGVTLAFSPAGVTAVSSGFSAWKVHLGWDDVTDLEFQGADEVKFTYDHRIDVNATAAIVGLNDGTAMVFEIKGRRPATLRSSMAPIVNAVKSHRANIHGTDSFQF